MLQRFKKFFGRSGHASSTEVLAPNQPKALVVGQNIGETEIDKAIAKLISDADYVEMEEEMQGAADGIVGVQGNSGSLQAGLRKSGQQMARRKFRIFRHFH